MPAHFRRWKADRCGKWPSHGSGLTNCSTQAGSHAGGTSYCRKQRFRRTDYVLSCRTHRCALPTLGNQVAGTSSQLPVLSLKETEIYYL